MGLAEPRKRLKLSHDPNNTSWSSQPSFGSTLMQKSGWTPGTALGASSTPIPVSQSTASQVRIRIKDDTLGLGANLKSRDIEGQRTGLDAFQGLLGRLNAKDQKELAAVEEKVENKKLSMFALGRWGGMMFVPGGVLVQEDPRKKLEVKDINSTGGSDKDAEEENSSDGTSEPTQPTPSTSKPKSKSKSKSSKSPNETPEQRTQRRLEKRARKEARLLRKLQRAATSISSSEQPDTSGPTTGTSTPLSSSTPSTISVTSVTAAKLKNGRHLLRGRNIQAKKMAFSDARGLDQIFMRRAEVANV